MSDDEDAQALEGDGLGDAERNVLDIKAETKGAAEGYIETDAELAMEGVLRDVLEDAGMRRATPAIAAQQAPGVDAEALNAKRTKSKNGNFLLRAVKGKILTWGRPDRYRLGATKEREHISGHQLQIVRDEHELSYAVPLSLEGIPREAVRQIACGEAISMALLVNGQVWVWGNDSSGRPMHETRLREFTTQIACGRAHMCAITDENSRNLYTWGRNDFGQLGNGTTSTNTVPRKVTAIPYRAVQVACGNEFTFMISDEGRVWAWGDNRKGQLGIGEMATSGDGRNTKWKAEGGISAVPRLVPALSHEDFLHHSLKEADAYPRLMIGCGQEHSVAWGSSQRYAEMTTIQVKRITELEEENERLKDELAEKKAILLKYEMQSSGGIGVADASLAAAEVTGSSKAKGPDTLHSLKDDPLLQDVGILIKRLKTERNEALDEKAEGAALLKRQERDVAEMKARAVMNAQNQSALWERINELSNKADELRDELLRTDAPKRKEEVRAEMRQVAWEITDKEGVAKASDRSHEQRVQDIHAKEEAVEDRRRFVQRATDKAKELDSMLELVLQLRKERVTNVKRRHVRDATKEVDALVEEMARLYSQLDTFRVGNLVKDREIIEFLRQRLGHPPTFHNFLWHSDRLLGELMIEVDDCVREVDSSSIVYDVVNDLAGMVRSGIDKTRLLNEYARGLMHTADDEAQREMRRFIGRDLLEDEAGPRVHRRLSEFVRDKQMRLEVPKHWAEG